MTNTHDPRLGEMGIPLACGGPLCGIDHHHPLCKLATAPAAPVAAQPDITQQTLDDVKAGIPARDAEIAALREELETLQAVQAQQPVSQLMPMSVIEALNKATGSNEWQEDCSPADLVGPACAAIAALARQTVSSADQFRNAAQMIAPQPATTTVKELLTVAERQAFEAWASDCGEFPKAVERSGHGYRLAQIQTYWEAWQARAALAQQDADKVDAERYRAWRYAACKNDRTLIDAMFEYQLKHFREGNPTPEQFNAGMDYALAAIDAARKEPGQ